MFLKKLIFAFSMFIVCCKNNAERQNIIIKKTLAGEGEEKKLTQNIKKDLEKLEQDEIKEFLDHLKDVQKLMKQEKINLNKLKFQLDLFKNQQSSLEQETNKLNEFSNGVHSNVDILLNNVGLIEDNTKKIADLLSISTKPNSKIETSENQDNNLKYDVNNLGYNGKLLNKLNNLILSVSLNKEEDQGKSLSYNTQKINNLYSEYVNKINKIRDPQNLKEDLSKSLTSINDNLINLIKKEYVRLRNKEVSNQTYEINNIKESDIPSLKFELPSNINTLEGYINDLVKQLEDMKDTNLGPFTDSGKTIKARQFKNFLISIIVYSSAIIKLMIPTESLETINKEINVKPDIKDYIMGEAQTSPNYSPILSWSKNLNPNS